ncbi:MAG: hypothetical protein CR967_04515 [Proteobacteria bacterium]|nr:MAG: hypothetical protein CR967_04515 [Pseudomonadota bacterium]
MNKILLIFFLLNINLLAREELILSEYNKNKLLFEYINYLPNTYKNCEVFETIALSGNMDTDIKHKYLREELKSCKSKDEQIFFLGTFSISKLISSYNITTKNNICYTTTIKNDTYPKYIFFLSNESLKKIKNRDFGREDKKLLKMAESSRNGNYSLPYPLINIFKNLKIGYFHDKVFNEDKSLSKRYKNFINNFQFPFYFFVDFNENNVEDAYYARQTHKEYEQYYDEKNAEIQRKIEKLKAKQNNFICKKFMNDLIVYYACMKNTYALSSYGNNKYALIASYVSQNKCDYVAGSDSSGLAIVCKMGKNGCASLKYSQKVIDACFSCNGSNRWLRMFAASLINKKTLPRCY